MISDHPSIRHRKMSFKADRIHSDRRLHDILINHAQFSGVRSPVSLRLTAFLTSGFFYLSTRLITYSQFRSFAFHLDGVIDSISKAIWHTDKAVNRGFSKSQNAEWNA